MLDIRHQLRNSYQSLILAATTSLAPLFPHPGDVLGWGLRVHGLSVRGPFLVGEAIDRVHLRVTLLNFSKEIRMHHPLIVSSETGDLDLGIAQPSGEWLPRLGQSVRRDPFTQQLKLLPCGGSSLDFRFAEFGYFQLRNLGRHQLKATLKSDGKTITAPVVVLDVVEVPPAGILISHTIPLERREVGKPVDERDRPVVQQVKVGERTLLVYCFYSGPKWSGGIDWTFRLAELPGKVEMTVEAAYGDGRPLTIRYKNPASKTDTTMLKINSIDGMPWTEKRNASSNSG